MKAISAYSILFVLVLACAAGAFIFRSGLDFIPGAESLPLEAPVAAFAPADDSLVIIDRSGYRLLALDGQQNLFWSSENSDLYGRIIAADMNNASVIYVIDQATDEDPAWRYERIVRVGPDGQPAGVILQKKVQGFAGFVHGALASSDDFLWFLFADNDGYVSLYELTINSGQEKLVFKTEWSLPSASLAVRPVDQTFVISAGGGLLRFDQGRFELLSEYRQAMPYASFVRYDQGGRLLAADSHSGVLAVLEDPLKPKTLLRQSDSGFGQLTAAAADPRLEAWLLRASGLDALQDQADPASTMDFFSLHKQGFLTVDKMNNRVSSFSAQGIADSVLESVALGSSARNRNILAWVFVAAACFLLILLLVLLLLKILLLAHPVVAMVTTCIPPLMLIVLAVLISMFHGQLQLTNAAQERGLAELRGFVQSGAAGLDTTLLQIAKTDSGYDNRVISSLQQSLRQLLASSGRQTSYRLAVYGLEDKLWIHLADSRSLALPGLNYRHASSEAVSRLYAGEAYSSIQRRPLDSSALSTSPFVYRSVALAPLHDADGKLVGLLELTAAAAAPDLAAIPSSLFAANRVFLLFLGSGALLLLLTIGLFSALRLDASGWDSADTLPDQNDSGPSRGSADLPPDFERDAGLVDNDLDTLLDETRFDMSESGESESRSALALDGFDDMDFPVADIDSVLEPPPEETAVATRAASVSSEVGSSPSSPTRTPEAFSLEDHTRIHHQAIQSLKSGNADTAVVLLEQLLDTFPGDARAWNNLAIAYKRQGRLAMAIRSAEKALALEPDNKDTAKNLEALKKLQA